VKVLFFWCYRTDYRKNCGSDTLIDIQINPDFSCGSILKLLIPKFTDATVFFLKKDIWLSKEYLPKLLFRTLLLCQFSIKSVWIGKNHYLIQVSSPAARFRKPIFSS
jgi:hypothetical protein